MKPNYSILKKKKKEKKEKEKLTRLRKHVASAVAAGGCPVAEQQAECQETLFYV